MAGNDSFLFVDFSPILEKYREVGDELKEKLDVAARGLAIQADAKIREWASEKLHTRRQQLLENLHWEELGKGMYAVVIDPEAVWIDNGTPPHNMLEQLLSSPNAKTVKSGKNKGKKYLIVPFKQNKTKTQRTQHQSQLQKAVRSELRKKGISASTTGKIERNLDGSPKMGLLHSFDIANPKQQHRLRMGVEGPAGRANAAHTAQSGTMGPNGRPYLFGLRVYQKEKKDKNGKVMIDKDGHAKAERSIFTFRIAEQGQGGWDHPGLKPMHFMEDAFEWVKKTWDEEIGPSIIAGLALE